MDIYNRYPREPIADLFYYDLKVVAVLSEKFLYAFLVAQVVLELVPVVAVHSHCQDQLARLCSASLLFISK